MPAAIAKGSTICYRVERALVAGPATVPELRLEMPDLTAQQINGALYWLVLKGRAARGDKVPPTGRGPASYIYELKD